VKIMWAELTFMQILWMMWTLNLFDVMITQCGVRHHGLQEDNLFLAPIIKTLGWAWFAVLKVGAVSWLFLYLQIVFLTVKQFRPFAWISAILAFILLGFGCIWNARLVLKQRGAAR